MVSERELIIYLSNWVPDEMVHGPDAARARRPFPFIFFLLIESVLYT